MEWENNSLFISNDWSQSHNLRKEIHLNEGSDSFDPVGVGQGNIYRFLLVQFVNPEILCMSNYKPVRLKINVDDHTIRK